MLPGMLDDEFFATIPSSKLMRCYTVRRKVMALLKRSDTGVDAKDARRAGNVVCLWINEQEEHEPGLPLFIDYESEARAVSTCDTHMQAHFCTC